MADAKRLCAIQGRTSLRLVASSRDELIRILLEEICSVVLRRPSFTILTSFRGIIELMSKQIHDTRECENCHAQMEHLATLLAIGAKPSIKVLLRMRSYCIGAAVRPPQLANRP